MSKKTKDKSQKTNRDSRASIAGAEIIETAKEAAVFAGRNARTLRRWKTAGMLMAVKNGKPVYIRSQLKLFAEHEGKQPTKTKMRRDESEAGIKEIREQRERMKLKIELGEWIDREEEERRDISKILVVKRALLGQGRKLAMQMAAMNDPRKIQALLDKENRVIIEGFSR